MTPRLGQLDAVRRHQVQLLRQVQAQGQCTDESLAAWLREVGVPCGRSTVTHWRRGSRPAPLGVLPLLLGHVDDPRAVLDLLARPHGLRVVEDLQDATEEELTGAVLRACAEVGDVARVWREAMADGELDEREREALGREVGEAMRALASLATALDLERGR